VRHIKDPRFNPHYAALPLAIQKLADKQFQLLKQNPKHPSLHFKRVRGDLWSVRVGRRYRVLAIEGTDRFQWFWIGTHAAYDDLIR
jgi:hypothetical protein